MTQIVIRMNDELVAAIDALVSDGTVASRSEAVRASVAKWVEDIERQRRIDHEREAYRRIPDTDEEMEWAEAAGREMIEEEGW